MPSPATRRTLIVANRTGSPCRFLTSAIARRRIGRWRPPFPLLERAARSPVGHLVGGPDALTAVRDAVRDHDFDDIVISTLPRQTSKWLRRDLIRQVEKLGLPVSAVVPRVRSTKQVFDESDDVSRNLIGGGGII